MGNFLSTTQRKELLNELKLENSRRYADRIRVILLLDQNWTYKKISEALFLDEGSIANYRKRYQNGGLEGLIIDDYSGKKCFLTEHEQQLLAKYLDSKVCLSTKEIISYIEKKFRVTYSVSGVTALLHRLDYSYKKAKGVPGKAKKEEQEHFLRVYNGVKLHGKVYFGDSVHPRHNSIPTYGWIKKGTDFNIFTNSGRFRINISGVVDVSTQEVIANNYKTINKESICDLLKKIRGKNPDWKKIYIILDGASYHKAHIVRDLAKELNIKIIFLPAYSPNLNPIERLWKFFKKKVLYNQYYETQKDFTKACMKFFQYIRKYKSELSTLLTDNFSIMGT
jgi:transposase